MSNNPENTTYLPTLPADAFAPMPETAEALPGSPRDYRFRLFALPELGRFEREDAAGRLLVALAAHGSWAAVRYHALMMSVAEEWRRHRTSVRENIVEHTVLMFHNGPDQIMEGLRELVSAGMIGYDNSSGIELLWAKPKLLAVLARYRHPGADGSTTNPAEPS